MPEQENRQYLDGCHDFCTTGEGGYLNTAVKCSLDTRKLQNFIVKSSSADDEEPMWNFLCLRGEREGRERGERVEREGRERGEGGRRGDERKKEGEGERKEGKKEAERGEREEGGSERKRKERREKGIISFLCGLDWVYSSNAKH